MLVWISYKCVYDLTYDSRLFREFFINKSHHIRQRFSRNEELLHTEALLTLKIAVYGHVFLFNMKGIKKKYKNTVQYN